MGEVLGFRNLENRVLVRKAKLNFTGQIWSGYICTSFLSVEYFINKHTADDCKLLHRLFYGRSGQATIVKRNVRKFCGFPFAKGSAEWEKKIVVLNR